jgi:crotonobetainyl-CoA:carnitine CoA-transferase CaiB-like acyl-CoA transferase
MQAEGGLMSITGPEAGPSVRVGVAIADIGAGMYATQAILAALLRRELGEHTAEVLQEYGNSATDVARFQDKDIV